MAKKSTPPPKSRPISAEKKIEKLDPNRPTGPTFEPAFWKKYWLPVLILIGAAFLFYRDSIGFGYVLDDSIVIEDNRFTKQGFGAMDSIFSTESMTGYFGQQRDLVAGGRYRPLSIATFAAEVGVLKWMYPGKSVTEILNPHLSHVINILLYGLTSALLFGLFLALFPMKTGQNWVWSIPFLAALIFVLHPLHTEVVANIKGRDEILALLGGLASVWFSLKYFEKDSFKWLIGSVICFLAGVFSKENAITFAAVVPLTGWFFTRASTRQLVVSTAVLLGAALFFLIVRTNIIGYFLSNGKPIVDLMNNPFANMKAGERLATIFLTLGWYLKLLVFPHPLTHDYYPYHVPKVGWSDWRAILSLVFYVGMTVWAFRNWRSRSVVAYSILFFLGTLFVVSNLPFSIGAFMNERFAYISSVAFCLLFGWFLIEKLPVLLKKEAGMFHFASAGLLAVASIFYIWKTTTRVPDWKNALTLNSSAIKNSPNSARANCFVAVAMFENIYRPATDKSQMKPLVDSMETYLNRALEIYPQYGSAMTMKSGVVAERYGYDHDVQRLLNDFYSILSLRPTSDYIEKYILYLGRTNPEAVPKLLDFCYKTGYELCFKKIGNPAFARRWLTVGLQVSPGDARLSSAMAEIK